MRYNAAIALSQVVEPEHFNWLARKVETWKIGNAERMKTIIFLSQHGRMKAQKAVRT